MAQLQTEYIFNGNPKKVFGGVRQYEKYPDYLPGVTNITVLSAEKTGSICRVRYELQIIKKFFYVLNMFETSPKKIWWNLEESNIMKKNNGSWSFSAQGKGKTRAIYELDLAFKGLVPKKITDKIAAANLPLMMRGFQKMIDND